MRARITHFVMMGDSLSDRGTLDHRHLGLIPMSKMSGLEGKSPLGRFTNGYVWTDHLGALLADQFIIDNLEDKDESPEDVADGVIDHDPHEKRMIRKRYNLDNDRCIRYKGHDFVRSYDEGGLTAHDYRWDLSTSISRFATRLIVHTLQYMRDKLLAADQAKNRSLQHKAETLVIEWSGANDLVTVNQKPSEKEVMLAIAARMKNVSVLIENGYQHFILFNMPDLSLTPRYHLKTAKEQQDAHDLCELFNKELAKECRRLKTTYPSCTIDIYDISHEFQMIYNHPEKYKLDKDKLTKPFTLSPDFKKPVGDVSPAPGYMFWDDIHPTTHVHALLAEKFYSHYAFRFDFKAPEDAADVSENKRAAMR
jgi:phospholipase/lecithinase/hemolysin